jgi:hypothetical protein
MSEALAEGKVHTVNAAQLTGIVINVKATDVHLIQEHKSEIWKQSSVAR